jgi:precorrin-6B methylase 2
VIDALGTLWAFATLAITLGVTLLLATSALFHLKWRVPFVPTPRRVIDAMVNAAQLEKGDIVLDLGAGDGRILREALRKKPGIRAIGYEGAYGVWLLSQLRNWLSKYKPDMRCENFMAADFSKADVIFTYLGIGLMQTLKPKFDAELRKGARVISHAFSIHNMKPYKVHVVTMPFGAKTKVYEYRW